MPKSAPPLNPNNIYRITPKDGRPLPFFEGGVAAGFPSPADDYLESLASWLQVFIMTSPHNNLNFGLSSLDSEEFTSQISGFSAKVNGQGPFAKQKSTGDASKVPEGEGEKPEVQVNNNYYGNRVQIVFPQPTDYTPTLIHYAKQGLEEIFRPGYAYKRGEVLLRELVDTNAFQPDLFTEQNMEKEKAVMRFVDSTNRKFGYSILQFAAEGCYPPDRSHRKLRSPCFTTRWDELLTIKI